MTTPFSDADYRALLDLEATLTALAETPGWQTLKAEVSQAMEMERRRLLGGELKDHDDYLKTAWMIRGAESVLDFPQSITKRMTEYRTQLAGREGGTEE